ncbi:MAG: YicC family protein [Verrucomicrobiales bacterium]|nr:YicC family protein [Verrucomicrobiales bacterium]
MTGFGRGSVTEASATWVVECSAVNRKQLEVVLQAPRDLLTPDWELALRQQVHARASRGRIQVSIQPQQSEGETSARACVDSELAEQWVRQFAELGTRLGIEGSLDAATLARLPGVALLEKVETPPAGLESLQAALTIALDGLGEMRETEGEHLRADIAARLDTVEDLIQRISALAPAVTTQYRTALMKRLEQAGLGVALDDERLLREVALFADRADISEELTRAGSHLHQFRQALDSDEAVGRRLDFLSQEFFREFNTMGAKANDAGIAHLVVAAKTELEKIREQVQNVE